MIYRVQVSGRSSEGTLFVLMRLSRTPVYGASGIISCRGPYPLCPGWGPVSMECPLAVGGSTWVRVRADLGRRLAYVSVTGSYWEKPSCVGLKPYGDLLN